MQPLHPHPLPRGREITESGAAVAIQARGYPAQPCLHAQAAPCGQPCSNLQTPDPATRAAAGKLFQAMHGAWL